MRSRAAFSQNGGCPALGEHYRPHSQKTAQPRPTTGTTRRNLILGGSEASGLKPGAHLSRSGAGWRACTGAADAERRAQRRFHRPFLHLCQILMEPCTHGITQPSHAWGKAAWRIAGVVRSVAFDRSRWGVDGHNRRTGRWRELNNIPRAAQLKWCTTEPPLGRRSSVGHPSTMGRLGGAGAALGGRVRVEHGREQRPDSPRKSPCLRPLDRPLRASDTAPPSRGFPNTINPRSNRSLTSGGCPRRRVRAPSRR